MNSVSVRKLSVKDKLQPLPNSRDLLMKRLSVREKSSSNRE